MKAYRTTKAVSFPAGTVLGLDDVQAQARAHALSYVDAAIYRAEQQVTFKAGETIGLLEARKGETGLELIGPLDVVEDAPAVLPEQTEKPAKAGKK